MNRVLPILTVVMVIVALWYAAAVQMNKAWVYDQATRAGTPAPGFSDLVGLTMNGVMPTYASIANFSYPGARPLYIYVKLAHMNAIPGLKEFVAAWAKSWGPDGLLKGKGMVVSTEDVRNKNAALAAKLAPMDSSDLK